MIVFFNLHRLDITQKEKKSDILLCLGGGTGDRIKKTIELYKTGYIKNKIIITDNRLVDVENKVLKIQKISPKNNIILKEHHTKNTLEELIYAQKVLKKYNYKSIIIVTDNPHTKRVDILIKNFTRFKELNVKYTLVGSNPKWWDKEDFYKNKKAVLFTIHEFFKIIYNSIIYSLKDNSIIDQESIDILDGYELFLIKMVNIPIKKLLN